MSNVPRLENYHLVINNTKKPDDPNSYGIVGYIYGYVGIKDGTITSINNIAASYGKGIVTTKGNAYELGTPNLMWLAFMRENKREFIEENPLWHFSKQNIGKVVASNREEIED